MIEDLEDLTDWFDELGVEPTPEQLTDLRTLFEAEFVTNPCLFRGQRVKVNLNPSTVRGYYRQPDAFVHLITRESKQKGHRMFDHQRANRLHWVRHILAYAEAKDPRIWYYEHTEGNGTMKQYCWYKNQDYIVILKPIKPDVLLVTAFCIDASERQMHQNRHRAYWDGLKKQNRTS